MAATTGPDVRGLNLLNMKAGPEKGGGVALTYVSHARTGHMQGFGTGQTCRTDGLAEVVVLVDLMYTSKDELKRRTSEANNV